MSESTGARAAIIGAAAELFSQHGVHGASIDAVAKRAGVAKGSIYYHFQGKDDLVAAVVERGFEIVREAVQEPVKARRSPLFQLETLIREWFDLWVRFYELARMVFNVNLRRQLSGEAADRIERAQEEHRAFVKRLIERGIEAGQLRAVDSDMAASVLLAMIGAAGEAFLRPEGPKGVSGEEAAGQLAQLWFEGVLAHQAE